MLLIFRFKVPQNAETASKLFYPMTYLNKRRERKESVRETMIRDARNEKQKTSLFFTRALKKED